MLNKSNISYSRTGLVDILEVPRLRSLCFKIGKKLGPFQVPTLLNGISSFHSDNRNAAQFGTGRCIAGAKHCEIQEKKGVRPNLNRWGLGKTLGLGKKKVFCLGKVTKWV